MLQQLVRSLSFRWAASVQKGLAQTTTGIPMTEGRRPLFKRPPLLGQDRLSIRRPNLRETGLGRPPQLAASFTRTTNATANIVTNAAPQIT